MLFYKYILTINVTKTPYATYLYYFLNTYTGHLFINFIIRFSLGASYDREIHCLNESLPGTLCIFVLYVIINFGQI